MSAPTGAATPTQYISYLLFVSFLLLWIPWLTVQFASWGRGASKSKGLFAAGPGAPSIWHPVLGPSSNKEGCWDAGEGLVITYHDVQRPEAYNLQGEVEYLALVSQVMASWESNAGLRLTWPSLGGFQQQQQHVPADHQGPFHQHSHHSEQLFPKCMFCLNNLRCWFPHPSLSSKPSWKFLLWG